MTTKPPLEKVLELVELKERIKTLYEQLDSSTAALLTEYGDGRFDYDLGIDDGDGRYLKFELADNVKALQNGETVWKSTGFSPASFSSRRLKRMPESLKDAEVYHG